MPNGHVYAPFIGAPFALESSCHICQVFVCKRRDNYKWRIHNVSCRTYLIINKILLHYSVGRFIFFRNSTPS